MTTQPHLPPSCARRFRPTRVLAQGGFGTVWLAQQISLDRPVAVKVLHGEVLSNETAVKRFLKEAQVTAQVTHPNVVVLVDHDVEDGVPWIAYEYVPGRSLRSRLEGGALPWREAVGVAIQIASALEAAHAHGVLHRDIKPDNVLEADGGAYKVADFGIARTDSGKTLTAQGEIVGTPAYLSPVQLRGEVSGPESDIYALGVTLYEMLTGELPFQDDNVVRLLQRHIMQEPPRPSTKVEGLPRELDAIVLRALAKKREDRFDTVGQMRVALERVLGGTAVEDAPRPSRVPRDASGRTTRPAISRPTLVAAPPPAPPSRARLALGGALVVALLAALVPFVRREPSRPPPLVASASPSPAGPVAREEPPKLSEFYAAIADETMIVSLRCDRPAELVVTARRLGLAQDDALERLPAGPLRHRLVMRGLKPGAEYAVTVTTGSGARVVEGLRLRIVGERSGNRARGVTANDILTLPHMYKAVVREAPDPRCESVVVQAIREARDDQPVLADLADLVRDLRGDEAARTLREKLAHTTAPSLRGAMIGALLFCAHPDGPALALAELADPDARGREPFLAPLVWTRSAELAGALVASLDRVPPEANSYAGAALAQLDQEIAATAFARWILEGHDSPRATLGIAAQQGLTRLAPARAKAIIQRALEAGETGRHNGLHAAVRCGFADVLAAYHARHPRVTLARNAAAVFGAEGTVPGLLASAKAGGELAVRAAAGLCGPSGPARTAALRELLRSPDARVAAAAAWAAGCARVTEALPELAALDAARDPFGYALWARARLRDTSVRPLLASQLAALVARPRSTPTQRNALAPRARLLAVAAAEMEATETLGSLKALLPVRPTDDLCLVAAVAALEKRARPRFRVMHGESLVQRTGIRLEAGQCVSASCWPLEQSLGGADEVEGKFVSEAFLHVGDAAPWRLKTTPHAFVAFAPFEALLCRNAALGLGLEVGQRGACVVVFE